MLNSPFERLEEGSRFSSRGRTVTESDVHAFAAQTGDLHPQHTDADWASRSAFGERIAHGMLVLSYAVGLVGGDDGDAGQHARHLRFRLPKRPHIRRGHVEHHVHRRLTATTRHAEPAIRAARQRHDGFRPCFAHQAQRVASRKIAR